MFEDHISESRPRKVELMHTYSKNDYHESLHTTMKPVIVPYENQPYGSDIH